VTDQVLRAYEYQDKWVNRMILGDSLVVLNSLLRYEGLGGQVQMVYLDPPYAVSFGSNFQPFIRQREVSHGDDEDMTREPETVQAYRDTWELGLHSYLTYLRDRFLLARELLHPSGSIFVQINDRNVHLVRTVLEEVFGQENFVVSVILKKKGSQKGELVDPINDYLLWFAKDLERCRERFYKLYDKVELSSEISSTFRYVQLADGKELTLKELGDSSENQNGGKDYFQDPAQVLTDFPGARLFASENLTSGGFRKNQSVIYKFRGRDFDPGIARGNCWKHTAKTDDGSPSGLDKLAGAGRLFVSETQLRYKRFLSDFGYREMTNIWEDIAGAANPVYVVQTNAEIVKRCLLMTTEPGDLVLDPTCGSGTTAYVAEQWGRRWITIDTSRVPLALARQRLLTATFPWYRLKDESRGPVGGFEYKQRRNKKGEEVGGVVPHVMSSTIANDESPEQELLVDRPEEDSAITRVTGPFCFEATIPTPLDFEEMKSGSAAGKSEFGGSFVDRMLEVLRRSPVLRLEGNKTAVLRNVRLPTKTLSLSAEAVAPNGAEKLVAFVFGPENGAVSEKLVYEAAREAHAKSYSHLLYVIGFAVQPNARMLIDKSAEVVGIPATYIQATPDLMMGDLLKNMRSSQIFSVCGLPEIELRKVKSKNGAAKQYEVELLGLDVFDPVEMVNHKSKGDDVPAWFLDTDYNDMCFHVNQAFFPRTGAWEALKKALRGEYEESVWDHLAGTVSAPFEPGDQGQIAVKVIDDRGNELLVVKKLREAQ
jgi:adenine-specific DNA-methyltransferase